MNGLKIMVVDDSKTCAGFLAEILQYHYDCDVSICLDGFSAFQKLSDPSCFFDLVFLDLHMPGMDGLELMQLLGKYRYRGAVVLVSQLEQRLIDLSAQLAVSMRLRLLTTISKPIDEQSLARVNEKLCCPTGSHESQVLLSDGELKLALDTDNVVPYFQAQIDAQTQRIIGFEALARVKVPGNSQAITPDYVLSTAQTAQILKTVDMTIYRKAAHGFVKLSGYFSKKYPVQLSVNLLPEYLKDSSLPGQLVRCFSEEGISPTQVCLEITERTAIDSPEQLNTLNRLRISGFMLAIDDFGTGFTNIKQLRDYPFTEMKIDRSLIYEIDKDPLAQTIVRSLLSIARSAKLKVVIEGVETAEEMAFLSELHGISLQGYLVNRPQEMQEQKRWMHDWMKAVNHHQPGWA